MTAPTREEVLGGLEEARQIVRAHVEDESRNDVSRPWTMTLARLDRTIACLEGLHADSAEIERLTGWLRHIEGGDHPCLDEGQLRQWAYDAVTLRRPAP